MIHHSLLKGYISVYELILFIFQKKKIIIRFDQFKQNKIMTRDGNKYISLNR